VYRLTALSAEELRTVLERALADERGLAGAFDASSDLLEAIVELARGDARRALTSLEGAAAEARGRSERALRLDDVVAQAEHRPLLYDKTGEEHYNVVSAFIKSMRGSDPDAAVYYMVRMLEAGEDPRFVLRRMVIFASEDVGNADPQALQIAVAALQAVELVGLPEGVLPMSQAAIYLALAPKSNAAIAAYGNARRLVQEKGALPVPLKLRNAPTALMKGLGYGGGYRYPHNFEGHYVAEEYLPDALRGEEIVQLSENGLEKALGERWRAIKAKLGK
jgi:putative ATPase